MKNIIKGQFLIDELAKRLGINSNYFIISGEEMIGLAFLGKLKDLISVEEGQYISSYVTYVGLNCTFFPPTSSEAEKIKRCG